MVLLGLNDSGVHKLKDLKVKMCKDQERGRETQSKLESNQYEEQRGRSKTKHNTTVTRKGSWDGMAEKPDLTWGWSNCPPN